MRLFSLNFPASSRALGPNALSIEACGAVSILNTPKNGQLMQGNTSYSQRPLCSNSFSSGYTSVSFNFPVLLVKIPVLALTPPQEQWLSLCQGVR